MLKVLERAEFPVGSPVTVAGLESTCAREPFCDEILEFLARVSRCLRGDGRIRAFPDVASFAFWIRRGSLSLMKDQFVLAREGVSRRMGRGTACGSDDCGCSRAEIRSYVRMGRGTAFHVAPSNVPVIFAYSLAAGLLTGNANIVRLPSRETEQEAMITAAICRTLEDLPALVPYVTLVRYPRDPELNDLFSSLADIRLIWGGDGTIAQIRKAPLKPRAVEITFADRYSLAVVDSSWYLDLGEDERRQAAEGFYNDTYLYDQNACTSPVMVIWTGNHIAGAREVFWKEVRRLAEKNYHLRPVQTVDKLEAVCLAGIAAPGQLLLESGSDNLLTRICTDHASSAIMEHRCGGGFFFEYECGDLTELLELLSDRRCQTIGYIGRREMFLPLLRSGLRGVDRIVPVGHTMDFEMIWDGHDLVGMMTRTLVLH